jgi:hypothetical protein
MTVVARAGATGTAAMIGAGVMMTERLDPLGDGFSGGMAGTYGSVARGQSLIKIRQRRVV